MNSNNPEKAHPVEDNRIGISGDPTPDTEYGDTDYRPELEDLPENASILTIKSITLTEVIISEEFEHDEQIEIENKIREINENIKNTVEDIDNIEHVEVKGGLINNES